MIAHRPATTADRVFVIDSWIASFRTSYTAGILDMASWHTVMWAQVERYLDRPDVRTVVACEKKDPTFLYGFISADPTPQVDHETGRTWPALVFYVFTKAPYRREGIARGLFDAVGVDPNRPFLYACKTPIAGRLATKIPMAKWNPLVARFEKEHAA